VTEEFGATVRIPLDWLADYVENSLDASKTAETLTMMGLEVEEVEATGATGAPVLNIKVMSNRGDCLSMIGVARELAADLDVPVKLPDFGMQAAGRHASEVASVEIADPDLCYRYAATVIMGVKLGPSPQWMTDRLTAAGMRPINNVVDVTNYLMLETGQPLHAFDYDLLQDHAIVVRRARPGEKLMTLDGEERELTPDMLAICDRGRAVAVAGVMGGASSEVTDRTVNVLIESACFNSSSIRKTARQLALPTEASYRFERGVDLGGTARVAMRAAGMIRQLGGGEICQGVIDACARQPEECTVTVRAARAGQTLGITLTADECAGYLRRLSLELSVDGDVVSVAVPSWRPDIRQEIDLIEEIGRVYGFNNLPTTLIDGSSMQGKDSPESLFEAQVRTVLLSAGLQEVMTPSIVARGTLSPDGLEPVQLRNALSADVAQLRASLIPGIVQVLGQNFSRGLRDLAMFEMGRVFWSAEIPGEGRRVAGCLVGSRCDGDWAPQDRKLQPEAFRRALAADFYQAKGVVESLLAHLAVSGAEFRPVQGRMWRQGYAAEVVIQGRIIGAVGEIDSNLRELHNLKSAAFGFELDLAMLEELQREDRKWTPASRFPAVRRDLAVVVSDDVEYARVVASIRGVAGYSLEDIRLFDIYRGEQVGAGKKSLALSLSFRSRERTLTDEEVAGIMGDVRKALSADVGAAFRDS